MLKQVSVLQPPGLLWVHLGSHWRWSCISLGEKHSHHLNLFSLNSSNQQGSKFFIFSSWGRYASSPLSLFLPIRKILLWYPKPNSRNGQGISLKGALFPQWLAVSHVEDQMQSSIFYSLCSIKECFTNICVLLCFSSLLHLFLRHGGQLWNLPVSVHFLNKIKLYVNNKMISFLINVHPHFN